MFYIERTNLTGLATESRQRVFECVREERKSLSLTQTEKRVRKREKEISQIDPHKSEGERAESGVEWFYPHPTNSPVCVCHTVTNHTLTAHSVCVENTTQ